MANSFGLPPNYQLYYFEDVLPEEWSSILEAAGGKYTVREMVPYIHYGDTFIKLNPHYFPHEYRPSHINIRKYVLMKYPLLKGPEISAKTREIEKEITDMLIARMPVTLIEEDVDYYFIPNTRLSETEWMTILYDKNTNIVAGTYLGRYDPEFSIVPNDNYLEIHPFYRKKGLCVPFTAYTYSKVLERVEAMEILNATQPSIVGCSCYARAARELGAHLYADDQEVDPERCRAEVVGDSMILTYEALSKLPKRQKIA